MRRLLLLTLFLLGVAALRGNSTPPDAARAQTSLSVTIQPAELQQGRTGFVRVFAPGITRAEMVFAGENIPLYLSETGDWVGFIAADINLERGALPLDIYTWNGETLNPVQRETVNVVWGAFTFQDVTVPYSLESLLDPQVNQDEIDTLMQVYSRRTPDKLWQGALSAPVLGPWVSDFGGIRNYNNGVLEGRHTGVDYRANLNEAVTAAGYGRVVFAAYLPIRGNHVVVDHGWGILTGYSHLNEIYVVPGQWVTPETPVGGAGTTGRSQGVHVHFELAVNGHWVDALQFMSLDIPEAGNTALVQGQ